MDEQLVYSVVMMFNTGDLIASNVYCKCSSLFVTMNNGNK